MADSQILLEDVRLNLPSQAGDVEILRGLSLEIHTGERVGIVGPSGSGKSSLLMIMAGLERATGGSVRVLGQDLTAMGEDALSRLRRESMGVVFQSFHLIPTMTAVENVATPLELAGQRGAYEAAEAMLGEVGLDHRLDHYPAQLSGGEQQRVALARALVAKPAMLLADEPTGNLDATTGSQISDLLFEMTARQGATLIMVTHERSLAAACHRIVTMTDGQIVEDQRQAA